MIMANGTMQTNEFADVLPRILEKRRKDCDGLDENIISKFIEEPWKGLSDPPDDIFAPRDKCLFLLEDGFRIAGDNNAETQMRRKAYEVVVKLLMDIDIQIAAQDLPDDVSETEPPQISDKQPEAVAQQPSPKRPSTTSHDMEIDEDDSAVSTHNPRDQPVFQHARKDPPSQAPSQPAASRASFTPAKKQSAPVAAAVQACTSVQPAARPSIASSSKSSPPQPPPYSRRSPVVAAQTNHQKARSHITNSISNHQQSPRDRVQAPSEHHRPAATNNFPAAPRPNFQRSSSLEAGTQQPRIPPTQRRASTDDAQARVAAQAASRSILPAGTRYGGPSDRGRTTKQAPPPIDQNNNGPPAGIRMGGRFVPANLQQKEQQQPSTARSRPRHTPRRADQTAMLKLMADIPASLKECTISATFAPDDEWDKSPYYFSCSIKPRPERLRLSFIQSPIKQALALHTDNRLNKWDPFWKPLVHVAIGITGKVQRCNPNSPCAEMAARFQFDPTAGRHCVNGRYYNGIASIPGLPWGKPIAGAVRKDQDVALLLRMLPMKANATKRADCHLWPKGTFMEAGYGNLLKKVSLVQRKQQKHDESEWKYICKDLDLCAHVDNPKRPATIQLITQDSDPYVYSVALCQYQSPERLFRTLTVSGTESLERLSRSSSLEKAAEMARGSMVVLAESDDEGAHDEEQGKLIFSLTCPISKMTMETPVRPRGCKHWQCFDLKNFLSCNVFPSGSRWRCGCCENFVALSDLQICGLTDDMLREFKGAASPQRDRVELAASGDYKLLDERKSRYQKRGGNASGASSKNGEPDSKRRKSGPHEVISLD